MSRTIFDQSGRIVQSAALNGASHAVAANGPCAGQFFYDYPWTGKIGGTTAVKARVKFAVAR